MKKSRFSEAQVLGILRQQDQGQTVVRICREPSSSEPTFYAWKSKFGGMSVSELQRLKHLEDENRRLKQLVADLSLENQVVKELLRKK
ncbi:MAG: transposase [Bacteroidota bacterium]|nr:transposase [Bacteroidota bacterium]